MKYIFEVKQEIKTCKDCPCFYADEDSWVSCQALGEQRFGDLEDFLDELIAKCPLKKIEE